jgi:hypothetical protein
MKLKLTSTDQVNKNVVFYMVYVLLMCAFAVVYDYLRCV